MELKIEHISKQFKDKIAVDDVSLTLTPGVWGLLGANGAGKTTLMRMIADIMEPTSGTIFYDGQEIRKMGEAYRNLFGFLPQDFGYSRDFTVKDYLEYMAALKDIPEKESKKGNYRIFDAYSSEKINENDYKYIWVHFVDFSPERVSFLQPKVRIDVEGELEFTVYNGKENICCQVRSITQWNKQSTNE